MTTNFPTSKDELTDNTNTTIEADHINTLQDKVGTDGDSTTTSHSYKLSGVTGTDKAVSKTGTETLTNKTLTSPVLNTALSGTAFLDEDNMSSNSATKVASQQSIKAYVDNNAGTPGEFGAKTELTIASGVITRTQVWHTVDTESDGATDDLDTINGGDDGDLIIIKPANTARTVVVKDGTGNINCAGDFSMADGQDTMMLIYNGNLWQEISRSANG